MGSVPPAHTSMFKVIADQMDQASDIIITLSAAFLAFIVYKLGQYNNFGNYSAKLIENNFSE